MVENRPWLTYFTHASLVLGLIVISFPLYIAFVASSREEVDRLAAVAVEAGARNMSGPRACPEYGPTYYAAFFDDPCGNKLEVCFTLR